MDLELRTSERNHGKLTREERRRAGRYWTDEQIIRAKIILKFWDADKTPLVGFRSGSPHGPIESYLKRMVCN